MGFIALLLKYFLLIGLLIAIFLIGIVVYLFMRFKHITQSFKNANTGNKKQSATQSSTKRRSDEYDDGVVVEEELYDERSPRDVNRKIFAKDEGEYVDFVEEE